MTDCVDVAAAAVAEWKKLVMFEAAAVASLAASVTPLPPAEVTIVTTDAPTPEVMFVVSNWGATLSKNVLVTVSKTPFPSPTRLPPTDVAAVAKLTATEVTSPATEAAGCNTLALCVSYVNISSPPEVMSPKTLSMSRNNLG